MPKKSRKKLCPVCGERIIDSGRQDICGRHIGSCGDAFWVTTDKLGRQTWHAKKPLGKTQ